MTEIQNGKILLDGREFARILPVKGAADTFTPIENGAWYWRRHTDTPVTAMRMEIELYGKADFTMIPAISYNGNGWGTTPEYVGDRAEDGTPWTFASHRSTIPACTYSENTVGSLALMSHENDNSACSLYLTEEGNTRHCVIFPEEEQPKTLQRHFWGDPFQGTMEPRSDFEVMIQALPSDGTQHRYKALLDFAWRFYGHPIAAPRKSEELYRLSIAYCRFLFEREQNGFVGFTTGSEWHMGETAYKKTTHRYELGWVGQSASMANAFIYDYLKTGDKQKLSQALEVHDAWLKFGGRAAGHMAARLDWDGWRDKFYAPDYRPDRYTMGEDRYENMMGYGKAKFRRDREGRVQLSIDACCLGTGAEGYFEAYDLLQKAGIDKPEYLKAALDVCDFALRNQAEDGSFAKSWDDDGNVLGRKGTIACFLTLPLITAYKKTKEQKYLDGAVRSFAFYYAGLERDGFTTAGALDTFSIDKESSSPLLRDALALYDVTGDKAYITCAEKIGWYLSTWMMHFTVKYPEDCLIAQMGYDTFGSTSVSTPHQALDQYALRDVLSFLRLYELTGFVQWRERALAFWCNACQGISDGTMYVNERLRPAGAQDEAIYHTRWGRHGVPPFRPSQWLPAWPCAFRLEALRWHPDHAFFDEGLTKIEGKIGE